MNYIPQLKAEKQVRFCQCFTRLFCIDSSLCNPLMLFHGSTCDL